MSRSSNLSRRDALRLPLATAGLAALASPAAAWAASSPIVSAARSGLARAGDRVARRDLVGVADFSRPSSEPRLHLVDLASGRVDSVLVAHGRGSDPARTGWLNRFSNAPGSNCTSEGAFLTSADYVGEHGPSLRLIGLEPTNSNAEARAIVVHSAPYVSPAVLRAQGRLGRSEGCFAVSQTDLPGLLQRLAPGSLLVSARL